MRAESTSVILRAATSARRMPVAYRVMMMVR